MTHSPRWKRLSLLAASSLMLAVTVWSAYLFTGIWLRVRCARQIMALARPLPVIRLSERPQGRRISYDHGRTWYSENLSFEYETSSEDVSFVSAWSAESDLLWSRVDTLQKPTLRDLWLELLRAAPTVEQDLPSVPASDEDRRMQFVRFQLNMWSVSFHVRYTCIVDSAGDKVWLVAKPKPGEQFEIDPQADPGKSFDLFLLDESGQAFARAESPGGYLVGRLSQRLGKADQLVFGRPGIWVRDAERDDESWPQRLQDDSERYPGRLVVCVVENAELKVVRDIVDFGIPFGRVVPASVREDARKDP